jgi:ABC-type uncharacterized transport system ATPase subunit
VALVNQGQLVMYGAVDEIRRHHSLPEVRVQSPRPLPELPAVTTVTAEANGTWRLLLADGTPPSEVLAALVQRGAVIERFEPLLAPMEQIFLRVVREGRA